MATLLIVRHGQAEGNFDRRFIGQSQVQLTAEGEEQAGRVADRLVSEPIDRIFSSDLDRCVATIKPLAGRLGMDIELDARLREIDNGEWTGLLPAEISEQWPDMWADYVNGADVHRPGGERWRDVAERVIEVVEQHLNSNETIVIGTHGGPTLILALWASGLDIEGNIFRGRLAALENGSITVVASGPRLVAFNDVGHLGSSPDPRLPWV